MYRRVHRQAKTPTCLDKHIPTRGRDAVHTYTSAWLQVSRHTFHHLAEASSVTAYKYCIGVDEC